VDGLKATRYQGTLEAAFARGQMAQGAGMLIGTVAGGAIAQATNLGVPYALRAVALVLTFLVALIWMRDVGFEPKAGRFRPGSDAGRAPRFDPPWACAILQCAG